ncbi:Probable proline iminopeptidase Short=PIP; AltName: Full=Prolyl aminopeptidase; Short=PAP [Serendipita indica DSM 11827]|nr:Probable proline iminopeptidase Short=PIP; AltName: Full=Prolyl aminopeptidase; Short=PAP [Serendipita indica DSM 11827]
MAENPFLFPEIEPYSTGFLKVSDIHELYYEVVGKEDGKPVIFIHGGPGGGCGKRDRCFFNPEIYKIILLDQRGSGRSKPTACLEQNTTWDLVEDIEKLRKHLGIDKWLVFGGSWGSTLSLAYSQASSYSNAGSVLTRVDSSRTRQGSRSERNFHPEEESPAKPLSELDFFYQNGASHLFPEAWEEYLEPIPEEERGDMVKAYHSRLNSDDEVIRIRAAKAWSKWEMATSRLFVDPGYISRAAEDDWANAFARIENHYFINEGFMRQGQLLEKQSIDKIRHLPCIIVQGRYDVVCPATTAWALKKAWPEAKLKIVPDAGHSSMEPGISKLLVEATNEFVSL